MVSVILTILNRCDMLTRFFTQKSPQSGDHEYVLVDNASDTSTVAMVRFLEASNPNVKTILNDTNTGFGAGNNAGVKISSGDVLVITQPDVLLREDIMPKVSRVRDGVLYGHQYVDFDGGWNRFNGTVIPYLTGYFLVCTKSTWNVLGGFDEIFYPADYEDMDLSYRAAKAGVKLEKIDVDIVHTWGASWSTVGGRVDVTKANRKVFAAKWGFAIEG